MGKATCINLGCGFRKAESNDDATWINVDGFDVCEPDVVHDLNTVPLPFEDGSADFICAFHVMEHIENWWECFKDCARVLKPGGTLEIAVPHPSSDEAVVYRDHVHVIGRFSFDGVMGGQERTTNAWFETLEKVPLVMISYQVVPHKRYRKWPKFILRFCADHLRNFMFEHRFIFRRV